MVIAFVVSKPLQIVVAQIILSQLEMVTRAEFVVVNSFIGACSVAKKLNVYSKDISSTLFDSATEAYRYLSKKKCDKIFIDSDVGLKKHFFLVRLKLYNPHVTISVYEEGVGTYRDDLYKGWKKFILSLVGAGTYFGGNFLVNSIYLFSPEKYEKVHGRKLEVVQLKRDLETTYSVNEASYLALFDFDSEYKNILQIANVDDCFVYLQSWDYDEAGMDKFSCCAGFRILKPHPHRSHIISDLGVCDFVVGPQVPAELLLGLLSRTFKHITVFHHGSSASSYIKASNVEFIELNKIKRYTF